jgi:threonine/homoserine/homoserine lactone efflux protein
MTDPKEIDLSQQKSEAQWQATLDAFFLAVTPKVFEWLRWVITLAVLSVVQRKSNSFALSVLLGITYVLSILYFNAFFFQFRFVGLPLLKDRRLLSRFVSIFLSALLGGLTWYLVTESVRIVVRHSPNILVNADASERRMVRTLSSAPLRESVR